MVIPVISPVATLAVTRDVLLLLQVPPGVALDSPCVMPTHTWLLPAIGAGSEFTVTVAVEIHPVGSVYVTSEVPTASPFITPPGAAPAFALLVLHVPPAGELVRFVVYPMHTPMLPEMAAGKSFTAIALVT